MREDLLLSWIISQHTRKGGFQVVESKWCLADIYSNQCIMDEQD
jgi:hypothetical protein